MTSPLDNALAPNTLPFSNEDCLPDLDGSDDDNEETVLREAVPAYSGIERVSIREQIKYEYLLRNRICALCFREDGISISCEHCNLSWCDEQCRANWEKFNNHAPQCVLRQKHASLWATMVCSSTGLSALESYTKRPFCLYCSEDVPVIGGSKCGFCGDAYYCSEGCQLRDNALHIGVCTGMEIEKAKLTRIFDAVFHRTQSASTRRLLENIPIDADITIAKLFRLSDGDLTWYFAGAEDSYRVACAKFDYFIGDPELCLDFRVADMHEHHNRTASEISRDMLKHALCFEGSSSERLLCLPRGVWINRRTVEQLCTDCFVYVSAALVQTLGLVWQNRHEEDVWILLRKRNSTMPCVPCISMMPAFEHP